MWEVRVAKLEDTEKIVPLFEQYRSFYRQKPNPEKATEFIRNRISNKESVIFIIVNSDSLEVGGFTQLYPTFTSTRMKKSWILNDLFVNKSFRGNGLSKMLMDAAKAHCINEGDFGLLLETERTNIIGNKLYPSVGFTKETNHFYYWKNPNS